jgi:hypothetical protein
MTWIYSQDDGRLYDKDGLHIATGYAGGNCGKNPECVNNPDSQSVKKFGPLPVGIYTFGEVVLKSTLGPFAIPLIPDKLNNMFGRGHFYVHGDTSPSGNASEGCIIMARSVRNEMYESLDHRLEVVNHKEAT